MYSAKKERWFCQTPKPARPFLPSSYIPAISFCLNLKKKYLFSALFTNCVWNLEQNTGLPGGSSALLFLSGSFTWREPGQSCSLCTARLLGSWFILVLGYSMLFLSRYKFKFCFSKPISVLKKMIQYFFSNCQ